MPKVIHQVVHNCPHCLFSEYGVQDDDRYYCMWNTLKDFGDEIDIDFDELDDKGELSGDTELVPDWCPLPNLT